MAEYKEPTQADFNSAEASTLDVMSTKYPDMLTKAGSVIRELLVRPFAYLQAWLTSNIEDLRRKSSVSYLMTSQLTENPVADLVASNYFVTRKAGTKSRGAITLVVRTALFDLAAGAAFSVGGVTLVTEHRVIAMNDTYSLENNIQYVPIFPYSTADGTFVVTIPVVCSVTGRVEIPAGEPVEQRFGDSIIVSASLTSPVTGGRDTETDAEMMARARYNTAESGIGSYYGMRKKLDNAPVNVIGLNLVAGEDVPIYRARFNSVNVSPGGFVDCYVKTQNQRSVDTVSALSVSGSTASFRDALHAGAYGVLQLFVNDRQVKAFTVDFDTIDPNSTGQGSRLGLSQVIKVTAQEIAGATPASVRAVIAYMPGINLLQQFVDYDANKFIGQDIQIKAAVPLAVRLDCVLKYNGTVTDEVTDKVKQVIADRINSYPVGSRLLNFSDVQDAVAASVEGAEVRLPCALSADVMLKDGSSDAYYCVGGVLDIGATAHNEWDSAICYFSITKDNIRLDIA